MQKRSNFYPDSRSTRCFLNRGVCVGFSCFYLTMLTCTPLITLIYLYGLMAHYKRGAIFYFSSYSISHKGHFAKSTQKSFFHNSIQVGILAPYFVLYNLVQILFLCRKHSFFRERLCHESLAGQAAMMAR